MEAALHYWIRNHLELDITHSYSSEPFVPPATGGYNSPQAPASCLLLIPSSTEISYISSLPCFLILDIFWKVGFFHVLTQNNRAPILCGPESSIGYPETH